MISNEYNADMRGVEMRRTRVGSAEMRGARMCSAKVRRGGRMPAPACGMTTPCRCGFCETRSGSDEQRQSAAPDDTAPAAQGATPLRRMSLICRNRQIKAKQSKVLPMAAAKATSCVRLNCW